MFFNGDSSTRKRVDLGGRSSKERDRKKLLEQTRLERNSRLWVKQQNAAAVKIQVRFPSNLSFDQFIIIYAC
jgi:ubiquitin-protein ligase E3 C